MLSTLIGHLDLKAAYFLISSEQVISGILNRMNICGINCSRKKGGCDVNLKQQVGICASYNTLLQFVEGNLFCVQEI